LSRGRRSNGLRGKEITGKQEENQSRKDEDPVVAFHNPSLFMIFKQPNQRVTDRKSALGLYTAGVKIFFFGPLWIREINASLL
jgi:hypothetical protein